MPESSTSAVSTDQGSLRSPDRFLPDPGWQAYQLATRFVSGHNNKDKITPVSSTLVKLRRQLWELGTWLDGHHHRSAVSGGIQLVCTGILGEYIGRTYMQSKGRPLYIVGERIGRERAAGQSMLPQRGLSEDGKCSIRPLATKGRVSARLKAIK